MKKYRNFFRIEQIKKYLPLIILVCIHCRWLQVNVEIFGEIRQTEYSLFLSDYAISFLKERYRHQNRKYLIFLHCGHSILFTFSQLQDMKVVRFFRNLNSRNLFVRVRENIGGI